MVAKPLDHRKEQALSSISHTSLSILRATFFLAVLLERIQLYNWRYISVAPDYVGEFVLPVGLVATACLALGYRTRWSAVANYLLCLHLSAHVYDKYHFDFIVQTVSFVFLFAPAPRVLSIDSWLQNVPENCWQARVPTWFTLTIFLCIELVYFDSLFFKLRSTIWLTGMAFWLPASLPHFATGLYPDTLEYVWLVSALSYAALLTELLFPLVLWKRARVATAACACLLHIGIAVFFPIPLFGIGMAALAAYFLPWESLYPVPAKRNLVAPEESKSRWTRACFILPGLLLASQMSIITERSWPGSPRALQWLYVKNQRYAIPYLGLRSHAIYLDNHFTYPAPLLRFVLVGTPEVKGVPSFDKRGYPDWPKITGRYWTLHAFRMRKDLQRNPMNLTSVKRYLLGWTRCQSLGCAKFMVTYKDVSAQFTFDFDQDDAIESKPWRKAGSVSVLNGAVWTEDWEPSFLQQFAPKRLSSDSSHG
jgi:hypothetical protein